jgi:hypothetical protein
MFHSIGLYYSFQSVPYYFDPSTPNRISSDPLFRDPYETLFVRLGQSHLPHAGQGLFAVEDITPATVVAFYNGVKTKEVVYLNAKK